jgi:hypothetical protein
MVARTLAMPDLPVRLHQSDLFRRHGELTVRRVTVDQGVHVVCWPVSFV